MISTQNIFHTSEFSDDPSSFISQSESRPEIDSLSLMKDKRIVWKFRGMDNILCWDQSIKLWIIGLSIFAKDMLKLSSSSCLRIMHQTSLLGHLVGWISHSNSFESETLRGYCTPGQFLDCFCIFLKNYNTLVTSKVCFL